MNNILVEPRIPGSASPSAPEPGEALHEAAPSADVASGGNFFLRNWVALLVAVIVVCIVAVVAWMYFTRKKKTDPRGKEAAQAGARPLPPGGQHAPPGGGQHAPSASQAMYSEREYRRLAALRAARARPAAPPQPAASQSQPQGQPEPPESPGVQSSPTGTDPALPGAPGASPAAPGTAGPASPDAEAGDDLPRPSGGHQPSLEPSHAAPNIPISPEAAPPPAAGQERGVAGEPQADVLDDLLGSI